MTQRLLKNGFFFTRDGTFQNGSLLVDGESIVGLSRDEIDLSSSPFWDHEVIDLGGRFVVPGFTDGHFHLRSLALKSLRCDLEGVRSAEELLERLSRWSERMDDPFVVGVDWDESRWRDPTYPSRRMLDAVESKRPVLVRRICGHVGVVNTAFVGLLEAEGVAVERDTGIIREDAVRTAGRLSCPDDERIANSFSSAIARLHELGITGIHDIIEPMQFEAYLSGIERAGKPIRISGFVHTSPAELGRYIELSSTMDPEYFRIAGVKAYLDGSLGAWTAALTEPYSDAPRSGDILLSSDELRRVLEQCFDRSYTCAVHAIGDRAVRTVLRQVVEFPRDAGCFRIEHAEIIGPEELSLLKRAPVYLVLQPNFIRDWGGAGSLYESRLGEERLRRCKRFRTLTDAEIPFFFGSDGMPPGPLYGLKGATEHPIPEERIPPDEALLRYTTCSHTLGRRPYEMGGRIRGGLLEPGSPADFVVLSGNPLERDLDTISVLSTYVGGKRVHEMSAT